MKLESRHWSSYVVEFKYFVVGWAVPTIDRCIQRILVGTAHPTIRNFCDERINPASEVHRLQVFSDKISNG